MSFFNTPPFLINSRDFSTDINSLAKQLSKTYIDIANIVNIRAIGIFSENGPTPTGETWYLSGYNQNPQELRQVYQFQAAGNIAHGIDLNQIEGFVNIYGTFTDGSVWYPLPYVSETAANNQVSLRITSSNIVITAGGGTPPTITSGFVVLEWIV